MNTICDTVFKNVYRHYTEWQPEYNFGKCCVYKEGIPNMSDFNGSEALVIINDLMRESDSRVVDLYFKVQTLFNIPL